VFLPKFIDGKTSFFGGNFDKDEQENEIINSFWKYFLKKK
jgi:hypothetical protein